MKYVTTYNDHRSVELAIVDFRRPGQRDPYEPKPDYSNAFAGLSSLAAQQQGVGQGFNQQRMATQQQGLQGQFIPAIWPFSH